ncbi:MAG: M28 family peptidase [Candidatus Rokuibacteriota bacterium]
MGLRDVGFWARARVGMVVARALDRGRRPLAPPAPLEEVLRGPLTPPALTRLLEGRDNAAREAALSRYFLARAMPFSRHRFRTFEGSGENFSVDVGSGDRVLLLIAHHDAVPGSPGANDNAASVAILLTLLERLVTRAPTRLRVRLLFPACEELGYVGARAYARTLDPRGVVGALSLELPGVGDSLALWDATEETEFLGRVGGAFESLGWRRDERYHVVPRIPMFGSDHRAFAPFGIPAYGLTAVPTTEVEALRSFIFHPVRAVLGRVRRPVPFDTYHTHRDTSATLDPAALDRMGVALDAVIAELGG